MASAVVTIGRRPYAVGLYWENSPTGGRVAQVAKEAAAQPGAQAEFYAARPGNNDGRIAQFGLCSSETGQKAGMAVLAGCMANQVPGSWAGAFRVTDGVVLIIVRDDLIVPDGDLFFKDESEARDRLIQEIGFGGLQTTYAPESWSVPGADTIPLSLLLSDRSDIKLQQVTIPKQVKVIAAVLVGLFVLILAGVWLYQQKQEEDAAALAKQQQEQAAERARAASTGMLPLMLQAQAPPEVHYEKTWESAPKAIDYLHNCQEGLNKVPLVLLGWRLTSLKCTGSAIKLIWVHEKGPTIFPKDLSVADNGETATQAIELDKLIPRGSENLADPEVTLHRYLSQNWAGSLSRVADDPPPPPPPNYPANQWRPPPPPWVKRSFTLTVPELPSEFPRDLGDMPGVVITNVGLSSGGTSGTWTIEGFIYENRK